MNNVKEFKKKSHHHKEKVVSIDSGLNYYDNKSYKLSIYLSAFLTLLIGAVLTYLLLKNSNSFVVSFFFVVLILNSCGLFFIGVLGILNKVIFKYFLSKL